MGERSAPPDPLGIPEPPVCLIPEVQRKFLGTLRPGLGAAAVPSLPFLPVKINSKKPGYWEGTGKGSGGNLVCMHECVGGSYLQDGRRALRYSGVWGTPRQETKVGYTYLSAVGFAGWSC